MIASRDSDADFRAGNPGGVLAGYDTEHTELAAHGWRAIEWFAPGYLRGGMANCGGGGTHQQRRERLWLSPHCLSVEPVVEQQTSLWAEEPRT